MLGTKFTKKAVLLGTAAVALTASASSMAALVSNGDFESGGDSWGLEPAGGATFSFETAGGNGGGYLEMNNTTAAWGGVAINTDDPAGALLADFGVAAGGTYDFLWDMKAISGPGAGSGIKIESWNEAGFLSTTGDQAFATTTDWASYSYNYTVDSGATRLKIVLLGINADSVMGYDNVCIDDCSVAAVPVPAAAWLFGSGLLGLFGIARRKKA
jgi:hypothetical protein